ncbi:MAG: hypothetical protein JNG88_09315 [Phycisphaerales bacterium]|nr:hypothetical protein [Phycisphaerales bacterium]
MAEPFATFWLRVQPGFEVLEKFVAAVTGALGGDAVRLTVSTSFGNNHVELSSIGVREIAANPEVVALIQLLKSHPQAACRVIRVIVQQKHNLEVVYKEEGTAARLDFDNVNAKEVARVISIFEKHFTFSTKSAIIDASLPETHKTNLRYYEESLSALQNAVAQIATFNLEQRKQQSEYLDKKQAELDERFNARQLEQDKILAVRQNELNEREVDFARKLAAFEMRESKVVRRQIFADMKDAIAKRKFVLSQHTTKKRWMVHGSCGGMFLFAAIAIYAFASKVLTEQSPDWHLFVPLSAATITFLTTAIYYIRWNDQWFREHAQSEFRNVRFADDMNRASWLAELVFEWDKEKAGAMPDSLLSAFSQGLFVSEKLAVTEHPIEGILGTLKGFTRIKVADVELEKGAKK